MIVQDLAIPATLFEGHDPLDHEFNGQALRTGSLRELIAAAMQLADCRLTMARIVTNDRWEVRGSDIERLFWDRVAEQ